MSVFLKNKVVVVNYHYLCNYKADHYLLAAYPEPYMQEIGHD